jgi:hypothetical protein
MPRRPRPGPTHVEVDSTGLKFLGEDKWELRQHGAGKCPTWRKVRLAVEKAAECTVQPNPIMLRICHPQTNSWEQTVKECRNERP